MTTFNDILPIADKILRKYDLCDECLGRLFSKQLCLSSNKTLGKKIRKNLKSSSTRCYICKNLLSNLQPYLKLMLDSHFTYVYSTFVVGAIIKPSIIDRDDSVRSEYKLRGIDSVKTAITKKLASQFTRKTKKNIDFLDPEMTFTINIKDESCHIRSKSISLQGRYNKTQRGLSQKQTSCSNCSGKGCSICNFHGIFEFDSVEGRISKYLFSILGGTIAKFTWIGGENKSSLVLGSGRPFFVKIQNPLRRRIRVPKKIKLDSVVINKLKIVSEIPKKNPKFVSLIQLQINTLNEINPKNIKKLKNIIKEKVAVYEKSGKRSEKKIFSLRYKKTSKKSFTLLIKVEGGLPIKRFVESDNVCPGVSHILQNSCYCTQFDFHNIELE